MIFPDPDNEEWISQTKKILGLGDGFDLSGKIRESTERLQKLDVTVKWYTGHAFSGIGLTFFNPQKRNGRLNIDLMPIRGESEREAEGPYLQIRRRDAPKAFDRRWAAFQELEEEGVLPKLF